MSNAEIAHSDIATATARQPVIAGRKVSSQTPKRENGARKQRSRSVRKSGLNVSARRGHPERESRDLGGGKARCTTRLPHTRPGPSTTLGMTAGLS
jgi:hypothetical protein